MSPIPQLGCHHVMFAEGLLLRPIEEAVARVEKIHKNIVWKHVEAMLNDAEPAAGALSQKGDGRA